MSGRRVFAHFVDDEVIKRIEAARTGSIERVGALLRLAIVISPDPPLFPFSARHELVEIAELLTDFDPLLASGHLAITGAGATPHVYLERRRSQYEADRTLAGQLFSPMDSAQMERVGSVWVAKGGDSTAAIGGDWETNVLAGRGGILNALSQEGVAPGDRVLEQVTSLPDALQGRPLIPDVISSGLLDQGLLRAPLPAFRYDELVAYLGSEWVRVYATDLEALVFRDLGGGLPDVRSFVPEGIETISARRAYAALARIGLAWLVDWCDHDSLARCLLRTEVARRDVTEDLFDRARAAATPIWARWEREALAHFDRAIRRRVFALRPQRTFGKEERLHSEIERRLAAYCEAISMVREPGGSTQVSIDKSINVGEIHGDAQIASGNQMTLSIVKASPGSAPRLLAEELTKAIGNDELAARFVESVIALGSPEDVDPGQVREAIGEALSEGGLPAGKERRLRRIASDLSKSAGAGVISGAVVMGIKAALGI